MRSLVLTILGASAVVILSNLFGLRLTISLYQTARIDYFGLEISWLLIALVPGAVVGIMIILLGRRSGYWWWIFAPGILIWMLRPWRLGPGDWDLKGAYSFLQNYVAWLENNYHEAPPQVFAGLVGAIVIASLSAAISGQTIRQTRRHIRDGLRDGRRAAKASGGGKGVLPQASWASAREVRERFNHPGGIVLGEHTDPINETPGFNPSRRSGNRRQGRGNLITMNPADGNGHVLVLAASAGYKTSGIVLPNILHYDGPLVVFDPKGDLYARTKDARREMGYDAVVIDAQNGFDPFKMIAPLAREVPSVYHTMAKTLMPLSSRSSDVSEFFHDMSVSLFAALTAHFVAENDANVARAISKFINRERDVVIAEAESIVRRHNLPFITDELRGLSAIDERTFPGLVKGISNKLSFIQFPDIARYAYSERTPEQHLAALEPKTDIFISIPGLAAKDFSPFPRLLIGSMFVVSELLEQPDRPRARRLFLIDEARVLGGMDVLNNVRDAGRSIGMHLMLIYQNFGQVNEAWGGQAGADAWLDSCEARVVSAVGSSRTAADISAMLGKRTIRVTTEGSSSQNQVMAPMGGSIGSSESEQLRDVPLMTQAALGQLPAHGSVIFTRRTRPIMATKAIFFTRKDMRDRVKSPESVEDDLDVTRRRKAVLQGIDATNKAGKATSPNAPDPAPAATTAMTLPEGVETVTETPAPRPQASAPDPVITAPVSMVEPREATERTIERTAGKTAGKQRQQPAPPPTPSRNPNVSCHEGPPVTGLPYPLGRARVAWRVASHKGETAVPFWDWLVAMENTGPHPTAPLGTRGDESSGPQSRPGHQGQRPGGATAMENTGNAARTDVDQMPAARTPTQTQHGHAPDGTHNPATSAKRTRESSIDATEQTQTKTPRTKTRGQNTAEGEGVPDAPAAADRSQTTPLPALSATERAEIDKRGWSPERYTIWGRLGVPFGDLDFGRKPPRDPAKMAALRRILWRSSNPARRLWAHWMLPPGNIPLNLDPDTLQIIPRPHAATGGLKILRLFDLVDWYLTHPDGRYELYDLKRRRRRFDGLEWRLHLWRCWIRNQPYGLPPGLQPSSDYPDHATLRGRISPATIGFVPSDTRYDPVNNAVPGRWFTPGRISEVAMWNSQDVGPIPPGQPPQLVFEHVPAVIRPDNDDEADDLMRWVGDSTLQQWFVAALLDLRQPPETSSSAMAFLDAWPEIPRRHAGIVSTPLCASDIPLHAWPACVWVNRVGDAWRLFRQPISGLGYPLGAACSWPITERNQE